MPKKCLQCLFLLSKTCIKRTLKIRVSQQKMKYKFCLLSLTLQSRVYSHLITQGTCTVEPRFNEPLYNEVLGITNDVLQPGRSYSKMYGTEPRYNEPRYNKILDITNTIEDPKRKINPDIMITI